MNFVFEWVISEEGVTVTEEGIIMDEIERSERATLLNPKLALKNDVNVV